ncbi:hypothetical protein [Azospirillum palustre]
MSITWRDIAEVFVDQHGEQGPVRNHTVKDTIRINQGSIL